MQRHKQAQERRRARSTARQVANRWENTYPSSESSDTLTIYVMRELTCKQRKYLKKRDLVPANIGVTLAHALAKVPATYDSTVILRLDAGSYVVPEGFP